MATIRELFLDDAHGCGVMTRVSKVLPVMAAPCSASLHNVTKLMSPRSEMREVRAFRAQHPSCHCVHIVPGPGSAGEPRTGVASSSCYEFYIVRENLSIKTEGFLESK